MKSPGAIEMSCARRSQCHPWWHERLRLEQPTIGLKVGRAVLLPARGVIEQSAVRWWPQVGGLAGLDHGPLRLEPCHRKPYRLAWQLPAVNVS